MHKRMIVTVSQLAIVTCVACAMTAGCGKGTSRKSKAKASRSTSAAASTGSAIRGKDVSKAVFGKDKPPKLWMNATYSIRPGSGDSLLLFPLSLHGPLSPEWAFVLNEATAWGVVEFEGERNKKGRAVVVDSPTDVLAERVWLAAQPATGHEIEYTKPISDVGDKAAIFQYDDKHSRDSTGKQIGYLVFRRGRAVVHLSFDKVPPRDLIPYAQAIDSHVQSVFSYTASKAVAVKPEDPKEKIKWTRGSPEALAAIANEPAAARADDATREKAAAENVERQKAAEGLAESLKVTQKELAAIRTMKFADCLTNDQRLAMRSPQNGKRTGKGWEYIREPGFRYRDDDGELRDWTSGAKGHICEPITGNVVGWIYFREGPIKREFSDIATYRRLNPTDKRLEETFVFDKEGRVTQYSRYLAAEAGGLSEPIKIDEIDLD